MTIKILKWFGRLGNNIIQVKNAIHIGYFLEDNIIMPKHNLFNKTVIKLFGSGKNEIYTDSDNFFYKNKINVDQTIFTKNINSVKNILQNLLLINPNQISTSNSVVIHLRGGDIFNNMPHPLYLNPPLSYYTNIIDSNNFENIILVSQDMKNPCINKLITLYKEKIHFKIDNLNNDINKILSAETVIESIGTFTDALLFISKNIKTIYSPSYQFNFFNLKKIYINLEDYYKQNFPWKNTSQQRELMINFK